MKDLNSSGGLCSQISIFASLKAVAKANDMKIAFSQKMIEGRSSKYIHTNEDLQLYIRIFDLLELEYDVMPDEFFLDFKDKHINFHTTTYDETLFSLDKSHNYNLVGRFDLYTYWYNDIGEEVAAWKYKEKLQRDAESRMQEIKEYFNNGKPTVSIHIRRGDYTLPVHYFCRLDEDDYYERAIVQEFLPAEDYNFVVFSNDIQFAKDLFEGGNVWFVEPQGGEKACTDSEKEDLVLMSLCDHHIIANSSYSWWGAFLSKSPNKKVICPTNWLVSNHPSSWINGRYYPPTWINIDNRS